MIAPLIAIGFVVVLFSLMGGLLSFQLIRAKRILLSIAAFSILCGVALWWRWTGSPGAPSETAYGEAAATYFLILPALLGMLIGGILGGWSNRLR